MDASDHKSAGPPAFIANAATDAGGWMRFDRYMELALYHPGEGYYASGRARIGAGGDFDTAAETSALFGRALAGQCLEALDACGGGDIAELGPGSGRLAEVLLEELKRAGRLPDRYILVEHAAGMQAAQRERLLKAHPDLAGRLQFTDRLSGERIRGTILANEVIDALPCRCFRRTANGWLERGVGWSAHRLQWEDRPADTALREALEKLEAELPARLPEGYCSEIRVNLEPFGHRRLGGFHGGEAKRRGRRASRGGLRHAGPVPAGIRHPGTGGLAARPRRRRGAAPADPAGRHGRSLQVPRAGAREGAFPNPNRHSAKAQFLPSFRRRPQRVRRPGLAGVA